MKKQLFILTVLVAMSTTLLPVRQRFGGGAPASHPVAPAAGTQGGIVAASFNTISEVATAIGNGTLTGQALNDSAAAIYDSLSSMATSGNRNSANYAAVKSLLSGGTGTVTQAGSTSAAPSDRMGRMGDKRK